jgi:hypothetical protein
LLAALERMAGGQDARTAMQQAQARAQQNLSRR